MKQGGVIKAVKPPKYFDRLYKAKNPTWLEKLKKSRTERLKQSTGVALSKTDLTEDEYVALKHDLKEHSIRALKRK